MRNTQSYVVGSLSLCALYLVYAKIYCSYRLLRTKELHSNRLPSLAYLFIRYLGRCLSGTAGASSDETGLEYTVLGCRLDTELLRRFCADAGYGWDYPDSEYRDIPLCFPEALCYRLLLMLLTDQHFRLSPKGLVRVCQTLKTLQPIDELKKGPFALKAKVLVYRAVDAGVEVDICLDAVSRSNSLVWQSTLTLLSTNKLQKDIKTLPLTSENIDGLDLKRVDLNVPRFLMMSFSRSSSDFCPFRVLSALCGCRPVISPCLWMLSVCLAETEKLRGVQVIAAPANVTAHFSQDPLKVKSVVSVRLWDSAETGTSSKVFFDLKKHGSRRSLVEGHILRTASE